MKKITPEEAKELIKRPVIDDCLALACGESVLIEKNDWNYKSSVNSILLNYKAKTGITFKVNTLLARKGWVVTRTS